MKKLAIILVAVLALAGCKKKSDGCVEHEYDGWLLPKAVNEYLPYQEGQRLLFLNDNNDSLQFEVQEARLLDYDSAHYIYVENSCYPTGLIGPSGEVYLVNVPETYMEDHRRKGIYLEFYGDGAENVEIGKLWFYMISDMYPSQCIIESEKYSGNVADLSDTICLKEGHSYPLLNANIVKGKGLVSYEDKRDNCVWYLVEE